MWTANIVSKDSQVGATLITIEYTDGARVFTEARSTNGGFYSIDQLKEQIAKRIDYLNAQDTLDASLATGVVTIPEKEIPPEVDEAKEQFFADCVVLTRFKQILDLGVIKEDDPDYVKLLEKVKLSYKSEYLV